MAHIKRIRPSHITVQFIRRMRLIGRGLILAPNESVCKRGTPMDVLDTKKLWMAVFYSVFLAFRQLVAFWHIQHTRVNRASGTWPDLRMNFGVWSTTHKRILYITRILVCSLQFACA